VGAEPDQDLTLEETRLALPRIGKWRMSPEDRVACPRCGRDGLLIIDRSTRPYAEWYALSCASCGLDATINIPLGPPVVGGMD
jgi:hypothetical protein